MRESLRKGSKVPRPTLPDATAKPPCCQTSAPPCAPAPLRWLPGTANFVALGCQLRGTGILQVFQLDGTELRPAAQAEQPTSLKCGVFGAGAAAAHLAVGNFAGQLQLLDLEQPGSAPLFSVQAHRGIVNALDTCGSQVGAGAGQGQAGDAASGLLLSCHVWSTA